jgi:hypothetical protein
LVFIALEVVAIILYTVLGHRLKHPSGTTMIGFGVALSLARRPACSRIFYMPFSKGFSSPLKTTVFISLEI